MDVFQAIADPTRREIIQLLSQGRMNVNRVAEQFEISRPAVSKHIKILTECGLIEIVQEGRERLCEAKLENLGEVDQWMAQYRSFWMKQMDALGHYLEKNKGGKKKKPARKKSPHNKIKRK
jgi:DNA-binding transcriptional ArsR family regulator